MVERSLLALLVGCCILASPWTAPAQPRDGVTERVVPDPGYERLRQRVDLSVGGRASPLTLPRHPYLHGHAGFGYGPYGYGYGLHPGGGPVYFGYGDDPAPSTPMQLGPITPAGRVTVQVDPRDAEVLVDGHPLRRRGDDPFQVGLLEGTHRIEVRAPGHEIHREDVEVRAGSATNLSVRLRPSGRR